jgi:mono/diheme cytochrome c family protein
MKYLISACLALWPAIAPAQEAAEGAVVYMQRCATCHGSEARGGGPMAPVLLVQPKDLTQLAAENDGVFPLLRVIQRIDGRDPLVSHGSDMPVYGQLFEGDDTALKLPSGQPVLTSRTIADLVVFLQAIQK